MWPGVRTAAGTPGTQALINTILTSKWLELTPISAMPHYQWRIKIFDVEYLDKTGTVQYSSLLGTIGPTETSPPLLALVNKRNPARRIRE